MSSRSSAEIGALEPEIHEEAILDAIANLTACPGEKARSEAELFAFKILVSAMRRARQTMRDIRRRHAYHDAASGISMSTYSSDMTISNR